MTPTLLERVLQRQGVDDRRQHAHVIGRGAIHALGAGGQAAEQVAAADDDAGLDAELLDFADLTGQLGGDAGIDAEGLLAHEGFAGELQQDAGVDGLRGHEDRLYRQARGFEAARLRVWECTGRLELARASTGSRAFAGSSSLRRP